MAGGCAGCGGNGGGAGDGVLAQTSARGPATAPGIDAKFGVEVTDPETGETTTLEAGGEGTYIDAVVLLRQQGGNAQLVVLDRTNPAGEELADASGARAADNVSGVAPDTEATPPETLAADPGDHTDAEPEDEPEDEPAKKPTRSTRKSSKG